MIFILGIITGLIIATLIVVTLIYLKNPVTKIIKQGESYLASKGPRPQGYVIEPLSEAEEVREAIIKRNQKLGRSTKLADLN